MKHSNSQPAATTLVARLSNPLRLFAASRTTRKLVLPRSIALRLVSAFTLLSIALTMLPASVLAQETTAKINLKKGFLKPIKFEYGTEKPKNVYDFTGLSFSSSFDKLISQNSVAHAEARKAHLYNGLALASYFTAFVVSAKSFLGTLSQVNDVNQGRVPKSDNSLLSGDFLLLGSALLVGIVSASLGHSHLKKGVQIYNQAGGGFVPATSTSSVVPTGYPMPIRLPLKQEHFGVRFGLSSANVSGKYLEGTSSKTGILAGVYYKRNLGGQFSLQTEGLLISKGYKYTQNFYGYKFDYSLGLTYFEVPVLARVDLGNSSLRPRLLAGPSFGFLLSSKSSLNGKKTDFEGAKSFETGIVLGAGVNLGSTPLSLDARYSIGMSAINKAPAGYSSAYEMKNRALSFSLGYAF